jgi:hypothetical protein
MSSATCSIGTVKEQAKSGNFHESTLASGAADTMLADFISTPYVPLDARLTTSCAQTEE